METKEDFIKTEVELIQNKIDILKNQLNTQIEELEKDIEAYKIEDKERLKNLVMKYRKLQQEKMPRRMGRLKGGDINKRNKIIQEIEDKEKKYKLYFGINVMWPPYWEHSIKII